MRRGPGIKSTTQILILSAVFSIIISVFTSCSRGPIFVLPENYTTWESTVDGVLSNPISGHTAPYRRIYINDTAELVKTSADGKTMAYPEGSVLLKENMRQSDGDVVNLTIMIKDPDSRYARGGWVWLMKDPSNGQETVIESDFCFSCHIYANEANPFGDSNIEEQFRDYVFYPYRP